MVCIEGIPVCIEAAQAGLVHGRILLVSEDYPGARLAFSRSLSTLPADWGSFVAFEFALTACLAVDVVVRIFAELTTWGRTKAHQPVRDLIASRSSLAKK